MPKPELENPWAKLIDFENPFTSDALGDDSFVADSQIIDETSVPEAEAMPKPELENPWAKLIDFENPFTSREHGDASKKPEETDTTDDGR